MDTNKNLTSRRTFFALLGVLAITVTVWLIFFNDRSVSNAKTKITIAQTADFFLYAPLYVAIDAGIFEKNGLDVTLISTGGDEKTWAAVLSGNAKFGVSDPTFVAVSDQRGIPGRVIANIVNGVPFWGITFQKDIPSITEPANLSGYSVATFPAPSTAYSLQKKMFQDGGLNPNIKQGAFGTLLAMLHSNLADIALELEPNVSQANAEGAKVLYSLASLYGNFAITGLTTTPDVIRKDSAVVQQVVCSIQQALDFIHQKRNEALKILSKRFREVKEAIAKSALDRVIAEGIIPASCVTGEDAWGKAITLRKEVGDLKQIKSINEYIENRFAEKAMEECAKKQ
jgi:NitT/TauT family transport system substrate-binding protein